MLDPNSYYVTSIVCVATMGRAAAYPKGERPDNDQCQLFNAESRN
jgi:hypothetical protein